jgi:hypothetical protein
MTGEAHRMRKQYTLARDSLIFEVYTTNLITRPYAENVCVLFPIIDECEDA